MLNLIFDLDGTLVDSMPGIEKSLSEAVYDITGIREIPEFRTLIGPPIQVILQRLFPEMENEVIARIQSKFREIYNSTGWENNNPYPGIMEFLSRLHASGNVLFVATNKPSIPTHKILEKNGLQYFFKDILCPDKRFPEYSSKSELLKELKIVHNFSKENTYYIGDQAADQKAAADCDILFVGVKYGYGNLFDLQSQGFSLAENVKELEKIVHQVRY